MTISIAEYEYGNGLKPQNTKTNGSRHRWSAVFVGILIVAAAAAEAYYGYWLMRYVRRLESLRIFDMLIAGAGENPAWIAVSEVTQHVWLGITWVATALLGFSGLWIAIRRRFGWRMLWTGAIATIVAAITTVAAGYVLTHYAGFPPQAKRIYAIAFLIHSAPAWVVLGMWLITRLLRRPTQIVDA